MDSIHGGDVAGYRERYGREPLDFSASLNPLGMPERVAEAARRAVAASGPYPDPRCRRLTAALARRHGVGPGHVFCGNGAADVIHRLVQAAAPRVALAPVPAFAEYERALAAKGCAIRFHPMPAERGFRLDESILPEIAPGVDAVFLCQPNNPTGQTVAPDLLRRILRRCAEIGALLVADECFCDFLADPGSYSLAGEVGGNRHLFVLKSFTKLYAMAGIRLGYGIAGDAAMVEKLHAAGPPWAVSGIAEEAGLAALGEDAYVRASLIRIAEAREGLRGELARRGFEVVGSRANFLFFRSPIPDLGRKLLEAGIMIRDCRNFRGVGAGHYRVAVRLEADNAVLVRAIDAIRNG